MNKKQSKSDRQKKRKRKKQSKEKIEMDLFEKITGIDKNTNAYYALKEDERYKSLFSKIDISFSTVKQGKGDIAQEARDRALNFITRKTIINNYIYNGLK